MLKRAAFFVGVLALLSQVIAQRAMADPVVDSSDLTYLRDTRTGDIVRMPTADYVADPANFHAQGMVPIAPENVTQAIADMRARKLADAVSAQKAAETGSVGGAADGPIRLLVGLAVLACAAWAAVDSVRLGARSYRSMWAMGPIGTFLSVLMCGIGFPWYLNFRGRVKAGKVPLKGQ